MVNMGGSGVVAAEAVVGMDVENQEEPPVPESDPVPPAHAIVYPHGGRIEMGELVTPEGPTVYFAMSAPGCRPSLTFWIDGLSHQPMIKLWSNTEGEMVFPLDKIMRSLSNAGHPLHRPKVDCTDGPQGQMQQVPPVFKDGRSPLGG